jgi:hypothetical protein
VAVRVTEENNYSTFAAWYSSELILKKRKKAKKGLMIEKGQFQTTMLPNHVWHVISQVMLITSPSKPPVDSPKLVTDAMCNKIMEDLLGKHTRVRRHVIQLNHHSVMSLRYQ